MIKSNYSEKLAAQLSRFKNNDEEFTIYKFKHIYILIKHAYEELMAHC